MVDRPACIIYCDAGGEEKSRVDVWATGAHQDIAAHFLEVHTDLCGQGRCRLWSPYVTNLSEKVYEFTRLPWASDDIVLEATQLALHVLNYGKVKLLGMRDCDVLPNEWRRFSEMRDMRKMLRGHVECDIPALAWLFG